MAVDARATSCAAGDTPPQGRAGPPPERAARPMGPTISRPDAGGRNAVLVAVRSRRCVMGDPVIVGVEGAKEGLAAVRWAAHEAAARGLSLHLLHSWISQPLDVPIAQEAANKQRYGAEVLGRAEALAHELHPELSVTAEQVAEPAVQALVSRSGQATMLVLGSRGRGALAGFLLGSVSLHVLGGAACPVVTVRPEAGAVPDGARAEVVVGLQDLGPAGEILLEFAFATADAHHRRLRVVRGCETPAGSIGFVPTDPAALPDRSSAVVAGMTQALAEALAPWQAKFPAVEVIEHVECGPAAPTLLGAASDAGLLIVGRRLQRSPMKLGPVAHAALHHACCPVAVVPHH